jgi:PKHD-type hydroxylase
MVYRTLSNNPVERTVVTYSHVKWQNSFTTKELDSIIAYCDSVGTERAKKIGIDDDDISAIEKKRRSDIKFHIRNENTAWIFDRLNLIIGQINNEFYNYDLNGFVALQYASYSSVEKGTFHWHMDMVLDSKTLPPGMIEPRKLSLSLLLNDPSEFRGGEFQINLGDESEAETIEFDRGTMVAFPSYIIHRVAPVYEGIRKAIVVWVTGPKLI